MNEIKHDNEATKILRSPFVLFAQIFFLLSFIGILNIIVSMSMNFVELENSQNIMFNYEERFFLGSLLVQLIVVIYLFLKWSSISYHFDGQELLRKTGIFFQKVQSFDIYNLDSISFHQTLLGRLFNYGNISLHFSNKKFLLKQIPNPECFTKRMNHLKGQRNLPEKEE